MFRKLFFVLCALVLLQNIYAQKQTNTTYTPDTTKMSRPKKATLLAFVPGLGQIYNKKYWKLPIVYGGFAALIYSVSFYQNQYDIYRVAVQKRNAKQPIGDPQIEPLQDSYLIELRDFYRESRDLSWIGIGGLYALQIIDAAVDAHLQEFDVSENLTLRWDPSYQVVYGHAFVGASVRLKF
ncbi:MAG: DUF5683 domain-containing protein [Bacteroidota bacterium]